MNPLDEVMDSQHRIKSRIRRRRYTFSRLLVRAFPNRVVPGAGALGIDLAGPGVKPTFLGIGFPRSGTTSVHFLLRQHPEVSLPKSGTKELHFFDQASPLYSPAWYFNQFEENTAIGEFTPNYIRIPESRDRIYDLLGSNIRFIVALRNPADRAYSHYWLKADRDILKTRLPKQLNQSSETLSFEDMLKLEEEYLEQGKYPKDLAFFKAGLYAEHLKWYFERFSRDHFCIFLLEDFMKDPGAILAEVCRFLGVNDEFSFTGLNTKMNSHTRVSLAKATRMRLLLRYKTSIEELQELLGRSLTVWEESAA